MDRQNTGTVSDEVVQILRDLNPWWATDRQ